MPSQQKASGEIVTILYQSVRHGNNSIGAIPGLVKQVINEGAWKEYCLPHSSVVHRFENFSQFVGEWLEISIDKLNDICNDDPEALRLIREVTTKPKHVHSLTDSNNITIRGTAKAYSLKRLSESRPDLYQRVVDKELSVNAAMIEAGFREKAITLTSRKPKSIANTLKRQLTEDQIQELKELL